MNAYRGLAIIFGFYALGEFGSSVFNLSIPGSVLGMLFLLAALITGVVQLEWVENEAELFVKNMSVMFIPPGVGIILYISLLKSQLVPVVGALLVSFLVTLITTAKVVELLRGGKEGEPIRDCSNAHSLLRFFGGTREKEGLLHEPVLLSIATIAAFLWFGGFSYDSYMESAGILKFLLGPAVVSLAVPVYRGLDTIKAYWKEITAGITVGGIVAILSAFYTAEVLGGSSNVLLSIAPPRVSQLQ